MKQRDTAFPFCSGNEVLTAVSDRLRWDTDCCWSVVAHTWTCFARAELDLFASKANAHCPLFFCHARLFGRVTPGDTVSCMMPLEAISSVLERVCQQGLSVIPLAPC